MSRKQIVIVNQHGENRGDEAAMRAMIRSLDRELDGAVDFQVMVQFRDRPLQIDFEQSVTSHHMVMPLGELARLALYTLALALGISPRFLLSREGKNIVAAIRAADLVISAPGGPYFGDIYAGHEPLHWLYIWLGKLYKKPLFLYAPSAGPFRKPIHNWFRRRVFRMFDGLCVREHLSLEHLTSLLPSGPTAQLTADAAIQDEITPYPRGEYFRDRHSALADKLIVAVTGMQYRYPESPDPAYQRAHFTEIYTACLEHLAKKQDCHFIFLPQLYGCAHDDSMYHRLLGKRLPAGTSWEVVTPDRDSDHHRRIFAMADICLASRYHPQIFATISGVPGVFPFYEHKQYAYLEEIGMREFAIDIRELDSGYLCSKLDEVIDRRRELSNMLAKNSAILRTRSRLSTQLAIDLVRTDKETT